MRIVKPAEERKNEILDVAEELFAEKGFDNASTNDIIKRIGIARGTLYHHFSSKEEILDALVDRMTNEGIARFRAIIKERKVPLLERLSAAMISLRIESRAGFEVLEQIHKPQNALLHQKMQDKLLKGVVPFIAELIKEGNEEGLFHSKYPMEAAEMIMLYSGTAFDDLNELTPKETERKSKAFISHTERILGAKENCLKAVIEKLIKRK